MLSLRETPLAEGTCYSKLEAATTDLQKTTGFLDDRLNKLEETVNGYRDNFQSMEVLLCWIMQSQENLGADFANRRAIEHSHQGDSSQANHSAATQNQNTSYSLLMNRNLKVEILHFDGTEAEDWTFKILEFFDAYKVPNDQRINVASFHMSGAAYSWYKWVVKNNLVQTWEEFLKALLVRFGSSLYEDLKAALNELRQTDSVSEYQSKFEDISTKVMGISEEWLISFFIAGLHDYLKCELLLA